jgi:hypothetical protein
MALSCEYGIEYLLSIRVPYTQEISTELLRKATRIKNVRTTLKVNCGRFCPERYNTWSNSWCWWWYKEARVVYWANFIERNLYKNTQCDVPRETDPSFIVPHQEDIRLAELIKIIYKMSLSSKCSKTAQYISPYIYHVIGQASSDIFIWQQVGSLQTRHWQEALCVSKRIETSAPLLSLSCWSPCCRGKNTWDAVPKQCALTTSSAARCCVSVLDWSGIWDQWKKLIPLSRKNEAIYSW